MMDIVVMNANKNGMMNRGDNMIVNDSDIEEWIAKCPEHDTEILHTDEDGIVLVVRFNNKKEEE